VRNLYIDRLNIDHDEKKNFSQTTINLQSPSGSEKSAQSLMHRQFAVKSSGFH